MYYIQKIMHVCYKNSDETRKLKLSMCTLISANSGQNLISSKSFLKLMALVSK